MTWSPGSWRAKPIRQHPLYADPAALARVEKELSRRPGLASLDEILKLKKHLADVSAGEGFLLQGGDCGESFESPPETARKTCRILARTAEILAREAGAVTAVTRLAGQYAKPRSKLFETQEGLTLPNYRGDIVNGTGFSARARAPDPMRMLAAYANAQQTLGVVRGEGEFFISHEALLLPFEQALLRKAEGICFSASAHMLWLGYRTRFSGEAHAEFLRGIANPLGVKVGPESLAEDLKALLHLLNPKNELGKVTLICRFGADAIAARLPVILRAVESGGFNVLWSCDPMHGNTRRNGEGLKVRHFADILSETLGFVAILRAEGVRPAGIHLEL
ncbi:MAG TPA: 3-deoxy-7-phosphoheptulonate synthase, partial [Sphingomonadales bacterium]|nr:3-deoxy-7-phosphoheptulonate synthase [Sphingomonadales bacterium]